MVCNAPFRYVIARTVMWEGEGREAFPYPDFLRDKGISSLSNTR